MAGRPVVEPWVRPEDYDRLKSLVPDYPYWDDSFDAWLDGARKRVADLTERGFLVQQPVIDPDEFIAWCRAVDRSPNNYTLGAFVVVKTRDL